MNTYVELVGPDVSPVHQDGLTGDVAAGFRGQEYHGADGKKDEGAGEGMMPDRDG